MFTNYLITAWRNITRDKFYAFINIVGLAIGITAAIFILLYVLDELTYDKSHVNYKRIYRLESHFTIAGKDDLFAATQIPLGPTLKDEYPEIEEYVRFAPMGTQYFKTESKEFKDDSLVFADSTIFKVFTHSFIKGDPSVALNRPYTMVLTESLARKFFGKENPIGKTLKSLDGALYEITGVIKDLPGNVHLKFTGIISAATVREQIGANRFNDRSANAFWNIGIYTYLLLKEGTSIDNILKKSPEFYTKYMKSIGDKINGNFVLMAKPLAMVHHYSSDLGYDQANGNIKYVYIFSLIALLIIIIASINYMNLATARSARRSKESGMRKIVGAQRGMLIRQFLIESMIITLIALIISFFLIKLLLPYFNQLASKSMSFSILHSPVLVSCIVGLAIIVGLLAGSYPAFYLSSFNPILTIKGQTDTRGGNGLLRKILVVFQFTISVFMIVGTFIVSSQLNYMRNADPGFNKNNLLVMEMRDTTFKKSLEPFKQELLKNPDITGVAFSNGNPGYGLNINVMRIEGDSGSIIDKAINNYFTDYEYAKLMGMKIVEGRFYDRNMKSDITKAFVVNETAAKKFGWVDSSSTSRGDFSSVIGKRFQYGFNDDLTMQRDGQVVGIIRDFNYASLQNPIDPIVLLLSDQDRYMFFANIRMSGKNKEKTIAYIDKVRQDFKDQYPFEYKFLDETLGEYYKSEERIGMLAKSFTLLTIIIAALGLLGLSSFLTQSRTREIGVRKVVGASANAVVLMFVKQFSIWVAIANCIAAPLAWYAMNKWLEAFPYKSGIHWWIFVIALVVSLFVALLTVGFRVIQAASVNPSDAMRYE